MFQVKERAGIKIWGELWHGMMWNLKVQVAGRVSVCERRMGSRERDWRLELTMVTGDTGAGALQVVVGPAAFASLGNFLEMPVLGPHIDLLSQKLWAWGPAIYVFTSPPGNLMQLKFESYLTREVGRGWREAMQVLVGHLDLIPQQPQHRIISQKHIFAA